MSLAADEIERLNARVEELEARTRQQAVPGPAARAIQLANNWRASR
jgi:BMFP domain-containing protein YqiC